MVAPSQVLSRTPLTMSEVRGHLAQYVQQPALGYLMALIHLENAGGASIYNHNWGNITTNNPAAGFQFPSDQERIFLLNPSHEAGAQSFFRRLNSPTHKRMLEAAQENDFDGFWRGYQTPHPITKMMYCDTCSTTAAKNSMRQLVSQYVPKALGKVRKESGGAALVFAGLGLATVAGTAFYLGRRSKRASN